VFLDEIESDKPSFVRDSARDDPDPDPMMRRATVAMPIAIPTLEDFMNSAAEILPRPMFERLQLSDHHPRARPNLAAFTKVKLRPRVLVDVTARSTAVEVLHHRISFPVMLAPAGTHMRAHPDGELASARAAGDAGTILILSHASSYSIEEVAQVATGRLWFQVYMFKDREHVRSVVQRAEAAKYQGLVVTVDSPGIHTNERDDKFARSMLPERRISNLDADTRRRLGIDNRLGTPWSGTWHDASITWKDMEWLRSLTSMPLVIKGVQTAEDARSCVKVGADGLVVSNHGGRSMEDAPAALDILPEIVDAVQGGLEVYMDGGIRTGQDVLKSLALGARAVMIGKPIFWGLAVDGEVGVRRVLAVLRNELDVAMAFCGVTDVTRVNSDVVKPVAMSGSDSRIDGLMRLATLLERGFITRDEFDVEKARLLS
jgi:4-hydroxymandelate oxidase